MSLFSISRDVIGLLRPVVRLNGSRFDALKCLSVSCNPGCGGMKAEFAVPQYLFDTRRRDLTDGLVSVTMRDTYDDSDNGSPDFLGYMDVDNADLAEGADSVNLSASTITGFFNKVGIGDGDDQPVVEYPLINPYNGQPTTWTPKRMLVDLLNRLPNRYKDRVALGDSRVLDTSQLMNLPDLEFRLETYSDAIDKILALFGDVAFTERFRNNTTYLDFYRIQSAGSPTVRVKIANGQDIVETGADVSALGHEQSTTDSITRVKAYGTKKRYILTILSYGETIEANLKPGWNPAFEAAVLKDPKIAKPGAPGYQPGMELVFRRFYLPAALRPYLKMKDLGIKRAAVGDQEGAKYKPQVWKLPTLLELDEETGNSVGTELPIGQLVKTCKLELDKGYFELGNVEDGLNITLIESSDKIAKMTWAPAKIGLTFCIEGNKWLVADTGADRSSGIGYDIAQDGLYDRITRDDLTYVQFTNIGNPVASPNGIPCEWPAYYFDEDLGDWVNHSVVSVAIDDTDKLMTVAQEHLRAKNRRHHAYDVTIPYFSRAFRPGYRLVVDGQRNWAGERMTITGVTWDMAGNNTKVTVDNVKPPVRRRGKMRNMIGSY